MQQPRPYFIITQDQQHQQGLNSQAFALAGGIPNLNLSAGALTGYPDLSLLNQFSTLLPQFINGGGDQQGGANGVDLANKLHPPLEELAKAGQRASSNSGGRSAAAADDSKVGTAYASRHQAAEQRRRTRINERLDCLRNLVPHTERANTASFLEEVIKHVEFQKRRVVELEQALQLATKTAMNSGRMERLSTAADAEHQHQQHLQHQQTTNLVLGAAMHLAAAAAGNSGGAFPNGGGTGGEELLPGLLASGLPNLRPQPQQHALFQAVKQYNEEQFNGGAGGSNKGDAMGGGPSRAATLSLSLMGAPAVGGGGQGGQQLWGAGGTGGTAAQTGQLQVLQLGQQASGSKNTAVAPATAPPPTAGGSPVSSEESGMPIKKRKVLVL